MTKKEIKQAILKAVQLNKRGLYVSRLLDQMTMWGIERHEAYLVLSSLIDRGVFEVDWKNRVIIAPKE